MPFPASVHCNWISVPLFARDSLLRTRKFRITQGLSGSLVLFPSSWFQDSVIPKLCSLSPRLPSLGLCFLVLAPALTQSSKADTPAHCSSTFTWSSSFFSIPISTAWLHSKRMCKCGQYLLFKIYICKTAHSLKCICNPKFPSVGHAQLFTGTGRRPDVAVLSPSLGCKSVSSLHLLPAS